VWEIKELFFRDSVSVGKKEVSGDFAVGVRNTGVRSYFSGRWYLGADNGLLPASSKEPSLRDCGRIVEFATPR
jgi:hypothetical protein